MSLKLCMCVFLSLTVHICLFHSPCMRHMRLIEISSLYCFGKSKIMDTAGGNAMPKFTALHSAVTDTVGGVKTTISTQQQ